MKKNCVTKFIAEALKTRYRIDLYETIMRRFETQDVSVDDEFQKAFSYFYRLRFDAASKMAFFTEFQRLRVIEGLDIETVLRAVGGLFGCKRLDLSFSSKLLATVNPNKPIWDSQIRKRLDLPFPPASGDFDFRVAGAVECYRQLEDKFGAICDDDSSRDAVAWFDYVCPDFAWMPYAKKVDFILWNEGAPSND